MSSIAFVKILYHSSVPFEFCDVRDVYGAFRKDPLIVTKERLMEHPKCPATIEGVIYSLLWMFLNPQYDVVYEAQKIRPSMREQKYKFKMSFFGDGWFDIQISNATYAILHDTAGHAIRFTKVSDKFMLPDFTLDNPLFGNPNTKYFVDTDGDFLECKCVFVNEQFHKYLKAVKFRVGHFMPSINAILICDNGFRIIAL